LEIRSRLSMVLRQFVGNSHDLLRVTSVAEPRIGGMMVIW
jgi:hypothetical protein